MEKILMGSIAGFAALTLLSYILIALNIPIAIIPALIICIYLLREKIFKELKTIRVTLNRRTFIILTIFILGIAGQLAIISPSGIIKNGDLLFWSANGHDGSWHIALMEEVKRGFPFQNPVYAGEKLVNYHFFSDILPAVISKYWPQQNLNLNLNLYFRIFPFFYSLFLGVSAYFLTKKITNDFSASIWSVIFTYFAGSFGFIVTYLKNRTIGGESIFWASQPQSASGNPPQIISDFLILTALYFLFLLVKKWSKINALLTILILGTISEFKIYAGVVILLATGIAGIWQLIKERKPHLLIISVISGIIAAALYLPNSQGATGFLIFQPWWYIRTMVVDPARLNWIDLELRREFYMARGGIRSLLRIAEYEGIAFLIFFFGNLGMRFLGLPRLWQMIKSLFSDYFNMIFASITVLSLVLPLLFLQKGVATNTSQFLQYFVLLMGITAGITAAKLTSRFKLLIPLIIILMIPTQVGLLYEFYSRPAFAKISADELGALSYIKNNTPASDVILTPPYDPNLNMGQSTPNIWDWFDTSYVSAFSARRAYFDDYEQVDIMGYDYRSRLAIKQQIFTSTDITAIQEKIKETKTQLVYFPKTLKPKADLSKIGFTRIYENPSVEVWQIN